MSNNVYIQATAEVLIFNESGNIVEETDWNEDKHILYPDFYMDYYCLDEIEYPDVLDFTRNEMINLLNNDDYFKNKYPNFSVSLNFLNIYSIYDDNNERFF